MINNIHNKDGDFQKKHRTEWQEFLWRRFLHRVSSLKSKKQSLKAIDALFSDYEKGLIARRLAALALIKDGVGTREISRILWLSTTTISNLKKNILGNNRTYKSRRHFNKMQKMGSTTTHLPTHYSWLDDIFDIDLWELIKNPPRPPGTGLKS